jgi:hypothetical protein
LDAIGTAHEVLHNIKQKNLQALILKLDLKKSFDCINWDFLRLILLQSGFGHHFTRWIMGCVSSATIVVLVNGEATPFFQNERGLRQGCPLSPLLFILAMEGLSILLKNSQQAGKLTSIKVSRLVKILHIFFVDDILIATRVDSQEWMEIDSILKFFCRASGLQINATKSTIHYSRLTEVDLDMYKNIFSYNFLEISIGLRYLGYFLKPDCYKVVDWRWLLIKFEKRIAHWCNRWLSLGGRFVLIKSVLESQTVYWMALAAIPGTVLKRIRQLIFSFLWMGGSENKHLHLCRWDSIAKPKSVGGWGLRNIFLFNKALASNSLWRVLSQDGIWHRVIIGKYITHLTILSWLRHTTTSPTNASPIWRSLLKFIHIIQHWLCWKPGSSHTIHIGQDAILGLGTSAFLSPGLLNKLHEKHVFYLFQAKGLTDQETHSSRWKNCIDLDLSGDLAIEWQCYCKALLGAGIQLGEHEDTLL